MAATSAVLITKSKLSSCYQLCIADNEKGDPKANVLFLAIFLDDEYIVKVLRLESKE